MLTCCACAEYALLQTFVDAAILAYECGMNEDSLRHELKVYKASLEQQVAPPGMVSIPAACACACLQRRPAYHPALPACQHSQAQHVCSQHAVVSILQAAERSSCGPAAVSSVPTTPAQLSHSTTVKQHSFILRLAVLRI